MEQGKKQFEMMSTYEKGNFMGLSVRLGIHKDPFRRLSGWRYVQRVFELLEACLRHLPDDLLDENDKSVI